MYCAVNFSSSFVKLQVFYFDGFSKNFCFSFSGKLSHSLIDFVRFKWKSADFYLYLLHVDFQAMNHLLHFLGNNNSEVLITTEKKCSEENRRTAMNPT